MDVPPRAQAVLKLLYFWPEDLTIDAKMRHVGLCEALVKYTM